MKRRSATEARNNFGGIIEEACHSGNPIIIERRNKPLVAIVPIGETDQSDMKDNLEIPVFHLGSVKESLTRSNIYGEDGR